MSEEQKIERQMPKVCAGAVIVNSKGKIFLVRSPKWNNQLVIPGGHVEWGETLEEALKREVREETGLTVRNPELIRVVEFIKPANNHYGSKHIVPVDYVVRTDDAEQSVTLDGKEGTEYVWLLPEQVASNDEVEATTKETIELYIDRQRKNQEFEEYKTGWQRAVADYQNLQKEVVKQRSEWVQMSEIQVIEDFLPVYDNFKKALASWNNANGQSPANDANKGLLNWKQGIEYIMRQFKDVLKAHKVEEIKTVGEKFDPKLHEAVGEEGVEGKKPGEIVREVDGGYVMGEKVIKVAKVIIVK